MSAARAAQPMIRFVDEYCQLFEPLFPEAQSFEAFKLLYLGMISEIKRKSLPAIAKAVELDNHQNLHHFLTPVALDSPTVASKTLGVNSQGVAWKNNDFIG